MFTIVLPIRDTFEEREMMHQSLPAAIALKPGEIIIALDAPASSSLIEEIETVARNNGGESLLHFMQVEKTSDWNFHLAKIIWNAYSTAKYDKIYSFDVDSVPTKNVLKGLDHIGKNGIAVYSFTKRLRLKNLSDLIRHCFYRFRVMTSDSVFSGNYWVDRKAFFEMVDESEYRAIYNGIDTYLIEKLSRHTFYKLGQSKEIGVKAMSLQNEDYPWRQFQDGVWLGANTLEWRRVREERRKKRTRKYPTPKSVIDKILDNHILFVYIKAIAYQRPYLVKGYKWARRHHDHEVVKQAKNMEWTEWGYQGGRLVKELIEVKGTGA